jgi:hypothetical protein
MPEAQDDLILTLHELGQRLDLPPGDPVAAAVGRVRTPHSFPSRDRAPWRPIPRTKRVLAAAAVLLVALTATLVAPDSRHAVARWLGIGSVTVTYTGEVPAAAGRNYDLGTAVPVAQALEVADAAGWRLEAPSAAGDPARAFVGRPAGSATLAWAPSEDLPEVGDSGIGLLLTVMPGTADAGGVAKHATRGTTVRLVRVGDHPAYWITGEPHEVFITDPGGDVVGDRPRLAGNTLIWTVGDITYRLESALDEEQAVELASEMTPVRA